MRAREEQISHLSCSIFNERPGNIDECIALARKYILEAERRAEQRVRAELSRAVKDADRFLWIAKAHTPEYEEYVNIRDFRLYIDRLRAREALMDMSIKFSDDVKYELFGNGGSDTTS